MKKLKYQPTNEPPHPAIHYLLKKPPISRYRNHIQNGEKATKEILMRGYKHFQRVSAVGETTTTTLKAISRSVNSKFIKQFQFDPYFCKKSCLKDLCKAFKNIKGLKDLNLVFRRLDRTNESDIVLPYVKKQIRLTKFRFELPKTNNFNNEGMRNLGKAIGKLVSLKSLQEVIVDLENINDSAYQHIPRNVHKNIHLQELKVTNHRLVKINPQGLESGQPSKRMIRPSSGLKRVDFSVGAKTSWLSTSPELNLQSVLEMRNVRRAPVNLEQMKMKFSGSFTVNEFLCMFNSVFPHLKKLTVCCIEFLGCRISDIEVFTLSKILSKAPELKQITLKVIQNPNISKDCILYLVKSLLQLSKLKKFELYFRRLDFGNWEIRELLQSCSEIQGLQCIFFKNESLHIFREVADEV